MNSLRWIDRVGRRLIDQGLPKSYVRRVVGELRDHHAEMTDSDADEPAVIRLGNPSRLAGAIAGTYRRQHFSGRHPFLAFVVAPVAIMLGVWALFPLLLVAVSKLAEARGFEWSDLAGPNRDRAQATAQATAMLFTLAAPALAALVVCRWALKSAVSKTWLWSACALMALLAFAYQVQLDLPVAPGKGRLAIGFGLTTGTLQLAVPLLVTFLTLRYFTPRWEDAARADSDKTIRRAA